MKKRLIILLAVILSSVATTAVCQTIDYAETSDIYEGMAEVTAKVRVTLKRGFHAMPGCSFHAYISATPPPSNGYSPETGGITSIGNIPNTTMNYIKTTNMRSATDSENDIQNTERMVDVEYLNGFGNPVYSVAVMASPDKKDVVHDIIEYGVDDRISKIYLPFKSSQNNGGYVSNAVGECVAFYKDGLLPTVDADARPWKQMLYDGSSLNRNAGEIGIGSDWERHPKTIKYKCNASEMRLWEVNDNGSWVPVSYPAGSLNYTETTDEDGLKHEEYSDKMGRTVLSIEKGINGELFRTVYVYDNFNRLRYIVPPHASTPSNSKLCYSYAYDKKGRVVSKSIPDHGTEFYVYDKRNRLVMSQDANQNRRNEWSFIMYDALNRVVLNGYVVSNKAQRELQAAFNSQSNINEGYVGKGGRLYGYSGNSFPNVLNIQAENILVANWYDGYSFLSMFNQDYSCPAQTAYGTELQIDNRVKGQLTGFLDKAELPDGDAAMLHVNYYDAKSRIACSVNDNHLGGRTCCFFVYDFSGNITEESVTHTVQGHEPTSTISRYEYDHAGRILKEYFKINGEDEIISKAYEYDAVGTLANTYLYSSDNGANFQQKVRNHYNIKGWLTKVNDIYKPGYDLFSMILSYNRLAKNINVSPRYNGTVAAEVFGGRFETPHCYSFTYNGMDRLSKSVYGEGYEMNQHPDAFTETYDYDANGNITGLIRKKDGTIIDKLKYTYYSGTNRINNITDLSKKADGYPVTGESYTYDYCGNPTYDPSKMAYITYSRYNKPLEVSASATDMVRYSYTSTGTKLRREVTSMSSTADGVMDYSYNFLYEDNELFCILAPFGRITPMNTSNGNQWRYHYTIADHLGNARVEFVAHGGAQPEVVQSSSYYPFGMTLRRNDYGSRNVNRRLYGGKELQDQTLAGIALNWYDFEARMYDPTIGRFLQTDPKAEKYFNVSPYTYCLNSPIMFIDPDGKNIEELRKKAPIYNEDGVFLGTDDQGLQGDAIIMNEDYFTQGMSHSLAMELGRTLDNMSDEEALTFANNGNFENFINHYNSLSSRPDWDGYLTDIEAREWWRNGSGQDLYVNQSIMNLSPLSTLDFNTENQITHNFFFDINSNKDIGRVYGTLTLHLINPSTGEVKLGAVNTAYIDTYDFNSGGNVFRNVATWFAKKMVGKGTPFDIYGWGKNPKVQVLWKK